jgi:hypothetical protein
MALLTLANVTVDFEAHITNALPWILSDFCIRSQSPSCGPALMDLIPQFWRRFMEIIRSYGSFYNAFSN